MPRTGYFFSEAAIYELKQLRNQLNLMGCLSAACGGDEHNEPTMAIVAGAACRGGRPAPT